MMRLENTMSGSPDTNLAGLGSGNAFCPDGADVRLKCCYRQWICCVQRKPVLEQSMPHLYYVQPFARRM